MTDHQWHGVTTVSSPTTIALSLILANNLRDTVLLISIRLWRTASFKDRGRCSECTHSASSLIGSQSQDDRFGVHRLGHEAEFRCTRGSEGDMMLLDAVDLIIVYLERFLMILLAV